MRRIFMYVYVPLLLLLIIGQGWAEQLPIIKLIKPINTEGAKGVSEYRTTASIVEITGVVSSDADIVEVTINDSPAQTSNVTSRDLALVRVNRMRSVRFRGRVPIPRIGKQEIKIAAKDAAGNQSWKVFTIIREELPSSKLGRRWALIIGIEDYQDPDIVDLRYSVDDAKALYEVLTDPERGGFDPNCVLLLTDDAQDPSLKPTQRNILRALRNWLRQTKPEDTVLFYFSGHGIADDRGRNYLVARDSSLDLLEDTAISMSRLNELLSDERVVRAKKIVVILDSCHSGARVGARGIGGLGQILDPLFTNAEGRVTLASCSIDEQSFEDPQKGHGVFTYYLVDGLRGKADIDLDGIVSATEVSNYVFNAVREWAWRHGKRQTPRRQANVAGEIWLSRDPDVLIRKLETMYKSGEITEAEYSEGLKLLREDESKLTDTEMSCLRALKDLLMDRSSLESYRLVVRRIKGLGVLKIETNPPGAAIFIDGRYIGVTPTTILDQKEGEYELELTKEGFISVKTKVTVEAGQTREIKQDLVQYGYVEVTSSIPGARIVINGEDTGRLTPATIKLYPGRYQISISLPGELEQKRNVEVIGGKKIKVEFAPGFGKLTVTSDPPGAKIILDGGETGFKTPYTFVKVNPGAHTVCVTLADYERPTDRKVTVNPGQSVTAHFALSHVGYGELRVNASPWAEVFLDGRSIGYTPLLIKKVKAGKHILKFVHPNRPSVEREIIVEKNKTQKVTVKL